jgi:transposase
MTTKTSNKSKGGRPSSYKDEYAMQALKLTLLGATDKELADFFEVKESTINRWKKRYS